MTNKKILLPEEYPFLLRQISALPKKLEVIGTIPDDDNMFLCVIGSRKFSSYGEEVCKDLIYGLRGYPVVIVSGLAIGIDSIAHRAALDAGLKTISFPGSGLDDRVLYPPSRRGLAKRIVENGGALISQFEHDWPAQEWTFVQRNRLMAGISHATLIIEAAKGSGTLITAKHAEEFSRDVMAVPGSIHSKLSYGPHMLIKRGAYPVTNSTDILEILGLADKRPADFDEDEADIVRDYSAMNLSPLQRQIVEALLIENQSSSDLSDKLNSDLSEIITNLSELELLNLVSESNGRYKLI